MNDPDRDPVRPSNPLRRRGAIALCAIAIACAGCNESRKTKIVVVRERASFQDPQADLKVMQRRLSCAGAGSVELRRSGDTAKFSFVAPREQILDLRQILTRPGIFSTTTLVAARQVPLFLTTLHLRFGRDVNLHPDIPDIERVLAAAALIVPEKRSQVVASLETVEFITTLEKKAVPAWGRMPGRFHKDGVDREGAELFLLPPPEYRYGPLSNDVIDSAVFVAGSDTAMNGVELHLSRQGRVAYLEMTQESMGSFVAILVDDQVQGAAKVVTPISSDKFWISGCGSDCRNLAAVLGGGPVRGSWRLVTR
ncbi:MAG: hypothetical protein RL173_2972 [Fibrobacterota bacterium]|jgi:hypothetical protein